eukprot:11095374-Alexandrium_andersonii.AAC.1
MQNRFTRSNLELRGPRNASKSVPELPRGAFCAVVRADSESAHKSGPRGGPRSRNRQLAGPNPQSANPQSAQPFAL